MKLRVVLIDDEALARERVRRFGAAEADLKIVAECASGAEALPVIARERPDLLLLDVQMPEMDGFELLERLPREQLPLVIFATAFDRHAVRAFEAHALDYLLKPFKAERFSAAIARAREQLTAGRASAAAQNVLELLAARGAAAPPAAAARYLARITVKVDDKVIVVKTTEVEAFEAAGNYVAVHVGAETHILRETLRALETQLDPVKFLRISRSALVNVERIRELQPMFKGEHVIVLQNGKQLAMTRGLREVEQALRFS